MISKRHVILAVLVVALGAAVYLNWQFSREGNLLDATAELDSSKTLGQAQLVGNQTEATMGGTQPTAVQSGGQFSTARQDREKARKDALDLLNEVINNVKATGEEKTKAVEGAAQIAKDMQSEAAIESLIKAKGFKDCVAVISDSGVNVIVKSDELLPSDAAQIKDIVMGQTKFTADNIKIIPVK